MKALVFSIDAKNIPSLISAAKKAGADEIYAVSFGETSFNLEELGNYGATRVLLVKGVPDHLNTTFGISDIIQKLVEENDVDLVLTISMPFENETLGLLSAQVKAPAAVEVIGLDVQDGEIVISRAIYGGKLVSKVKLSGKPKLLSLTPGAFEAKKISDAKAEIVEVQTTPSEDGIKLLERSEVKVAGKPLEDADIVIGVGRGVKNKEDLSMIYELAELLDAAVGCTRPLSADYGWFDEWIGVSGKRIAPKLYLVVGASGSVQHMAGVRGSKYIIAINKDGEAPVFEESDYLFVEDLYKLVPAIVEELKKIK